MFGRRNLIRLEVALVAFLMFAYNVNLRQVSSYDTYASRFVPISVVRGGDLALDEFFPEYADRPDGHINDYLFRSGGRLYDSHPPVGPLLAVAVYAVPVWLGIPADTVAAANLLSKLAASLMAALSALAVFAATRRLLTAATGLGSTEAGAEAEAEAEVAPTQEASTLVHRVALGAALAFGLGTSVWSTASQAMWAQTPALLAYTFALWALATGAWGAAGIAIGAAVLARPATAPAAALLVLYTLHVTWRRTRVEGRASGVARTAWRQAATCYAALASIGLLGLAYNLRIFGNIGGGASFRTEYWVQRLNAPHMFAGSVVEGLAGLTISPSRGIFVFSPIVILALVGAHRVWKANLSASPGGAAQEAVLLARYASLAAIAVLIVYSKYLVWWGGHGYGPRYLTDLMPFAGLLFGFGMIGSDRLAGRSPPAMSLINPTSVLVTVLFAYSVAVQAVGAFCWPSPWSLETDDLPLWDWRNSQIVACLRAGPRIDPVAQRLFESLGR